MIRRLALADNKLNDCRGGAGCVLSAVAPDDAERLRLQEQFALDDFDFNSALDPDEVPRLEVAEGRMLLIWKVPENASVSHAIHLNVGTVGFLWRGEQLCLLRKSGEMNFSDREFRKLNDVPDVLLACLLYTVHHFVGHLKIIRQMSNELEKKITVSMENKHLLQMFSLGESLIFYVDAIEANRAVLTKLRTAGERLGMQPRHLLLLDDVMLENAQAAQQARIFSSVLSGLMDARGTIVNNNMNVLLKNLTLINIVFLPLNLVASIFGMSEWGVITKDLDWRLSYALFCLGMLVMGWGTWVLVRRIIDRGSAQGWFSKGAASPQER